MIHAVTTPHQIDELLESGCGQAFAKEIKWAGTFRPEVFKRNWVLFLDRGIGGLWMLELDSQIVGTIGGLCYPDANDDLPTSSELFWYVLPDYRGSLQAVRLFDRLEQWAVLKNSARHSMIRHHQSMDSRIEEFYERRGYVRSETIFTKALVK